MEQANTCPICGQIYSSALCPRCGFENRLMLVSEPNPIIQQIDEQRIEIAKRSWDFAIKLQEEIESLTKENQNAQSQITELNQTIEGLNSQINKLSAVDDENKSLRQELVEQQQNIDALSAERDKLLNEKSQLNKERKELEDRIKDLSDKLSSAHLDNSRLEAELKEKQEGTSQFQKLKDQISDYLDQRAQLKKEKEEWKTKSDKWESKFNELSTKMSEAQYTIEQQKSQIQNTKKALDEANRKKIVETVKRPMAFLLLKGIGEETVGAVYQGNNSYGCMFGGINDPNHQELSIDGLKPFHFRIETIGNRFLLHDAVGNITSANGELIGSKGQILINDTRFSIGKTLKVTFIIIS